jgi:hypothetical protein
MVEGKELRSMQRKAKKLAKENGKTEADVLAELLQEAGLKDQAEDVKVEADDKAAAKNGKDENNEDESDSDARTVSAVITSHPLSRDVHIEQFTLLFHGHELLMDAKLELNHGRCVPALASACVRSASCKLRCKRRRSGGTWPTRSARFMIQLTASSLLPALPASKRAAVAGTSMVPAAAA